jgi:hypothetical protein
MEDVAGNLLRGWLLKRHVGILCDVLDALGIAHKEGVVDDLPDSVDDAKLKAAVETLLAKHPHEIVAVYLLTFNHMNQTRWAHLDVLMQGDPRLQLGG